MARPISLFLVPYVGGVPHLFRGSAAPFLQWENQKPWGAADSRREKRMECPEGQLVGGSLGFLIVEHDRLSLVLMFGHRTRSVPWATVSQRPDNRTVSPHVLTLNKLGRSIS